MPSSNQNRDFTEEIYGRYPLDAAIEWIKKNMSVDEVFDKRDILSYVSYNFSPEQVFKIDDILDIAKEEGWVNIEEYRDQQINKIISK